MTHETRAADKGGEVVGEANSWYCQAQIDEMERDSRGSLACKCGSFPTPSGNYVRPDDGWRSMWCQGCMEHVVGWCQTETKALDEWNRKREIELSAAPSAPTPANPLPPRLDERLRYVADGKVMSIVADGVTYVRQDAPTPTNLGDALAFVERVAKLSLVGEMEDEESSQNASERSADEFDNIIRQARAALTRYREGKPA